MLRKNCEECGLEDVDRGGNRMCDGCFPVCVGQSFPLDALGRQHACYMHSICSRCIKLSADKRQKKWSTIYKGKAVASIPKNINISSDNNLFYLCARCSSDTLVHEDVWGENVQEASFFLPSGAIHATTAPSRPPESILLLQPADTFQNAQKERCDRQKRDAKRFRRSGSEFAMASATKFIRTCRSTFMPRTVQQCMLDMFHDLHKDFVQRIATVNKVDLSSFAMPACPLARSLDAVEANAASGMLIDGDVAYKSATFSAHHLDQQQKVAVVRIGALEAHLQSLLMDSRLSPQLLFLNESKVERVYTDQNGERLLGPEPWHGSHWGKMESTIEPGAVLIAIAIHSDETDTVHGNRYPFSVSILNHALSCRKTDPGSRVVGFGPILHIHRARGCLHHDSLNPTQRAAKAQIHASAPAHILSDLDYLAKHVRTFSLWTGQGPLRVRVQVRVGLYNADFKEKISIVGMGAYRCARCHGYENAVRLQQSATLTTAILSRPYMSAELGSRCGTAQPRTVTSTLLIQKELVQLRRHRAPAQDIKHVESTTGVNADVEPMLHRLTNLLPHRIGGPYVVQAVDLLHSLHLGICTKLVNMVDALVLSVFVKGENLRSKDDCRNVVDSVLAHMPPFRDYITFKAGWWTASHAKGTNGAESVALLSQYAFVFVEDRQLIPDNRMRKKVLGLIWIVVEILRELRTPQWYTEKELADLDHRIVQMIRLFHWLMDLLVEHDSPVGHGMNIPKLHETLSAVHMLRQFGSLQNANCDAGERRNQKTKKIDARIGKRSRNDDGGDSITTKLMSIEMDAALHANELHRNDMEEHAHSTKSSKPATTTACSMSASSSFIDFLDEEHWTVFCLNLASGKNGPQIPPEATHRLQDFAQEWAARDVVRCQPRIYFNECNVYLRTKSLRVLLPGHCVELVKRGTFAQILVLNLTAGEFSREATTLLIVWHFETQTQNHHELPLQHLSRGDISVIPLTAVFRRAHVVPIFKAGLRVASTSASAPFCATHFLVNTSVYERVAAPEDRRVFLNCPFCSFPTEEPEMEGSTVTCLNCKESFHWL